MAITITTKTSGILGTTSAQTRTTASMSFTSGNRVLVVGHALRDGHTNGLGANWAVSDSATTNDPTWTQIGIGAAYDWGGGAQFATQVVAFISSVLTANESFTVTIDPHSGGTSLFYMGAQVFEVTGYGSTTQTASAEDPDGGDTVTFGSTPSGFQLVIGLALASFDDIVWATAPTNFTLVASSTATPNGGMGCAAVSSTTNTGTSVAWSYTNTGVLAINLLALELAEAASGTNATAGVATGTGEAYGPLPAVAAVADVAAGSGAAYGPGVSGTADPATATGTGAAGDPVPSVGAAAAAAAGSGAAHEPGVSGTADPASATSIGTAHDPTILTGGQALAEVAAGSGGAHDPGTSGTAYPATGTGTGTGHDATVDTGTASSYSDDFNRADGADLGADWTAVAGGMRIETNTAYAGTLGSTAGTLHRERWDGGTLGSADMVVQGTIDELSTGGYSDLRLMARWSGSTSFYELRINNSGEWYINQVTTGGEVDIASGTGLTLALPEVWRLEVQGTGATVTLRVYRGGSLLATHDDTTGARITTGTTGGIGGYTAGGTPPDIRLDDWSMSELSGTAAAQVATGTGAANTPAPSIVVGAGTATGTGAALFDAGSEISLEVIQDNPINAAGQASNATPAVAPTPGVVTGSGTAYDATATGTGGGGTAGAIVATGTGTAHDPAVSTGPTVVVAAGADAAHDPVPSIAAATIAPDGPGGAHGITGSVAPVVDTATGTGAADGTTAAVAAPVDVAAGAGAAHDATISTAAQTQAPADVAAGTGAAHEPGTSGTADPATATSTGTAHDPTPSVPGDAIAETGTGTGTAHAPAPSGAPIVDVAAGAGAAHDARGTVPGFVTAIVATGTGMAYTTGPPSIDLEGRRPTGRNWGDLLAILHQEVVETMAASPVPTTCPNDGTILQRGPGGILFCTWDGWSTLTSGDAW